MLINALSELKFGPRIFSIAKKQTFRCEVHPVNKSNQAQGQSFANTPYWLSGMLPVRFCQYQASNLEWFLKYLIFKAENIGLILYYAIKDRAPFS